MNGYGIALIVIAAISITGSLLKHGKPMEGRYNFFTSLLAWALIFWLTWEAGAFRG